MSKTLPKQYSEEATANIQVRRGLLVSILDNIVELKKIREEQLTFFCAVQRGGNQKGIIVTSAMTVLTVASVTFYGLTFTPYSAIGVVGGVVMDAGMLVLDATNVIINHKQGGKMETELKKSKPYEEHLCALSEELQNHVNVVVQNFKIPLAEAELAVLRMSLDFSPSSALEWASNNKKRIYDVANLTTDIVDALKNMYRGGAGEGKLVLGIMKAGGKSAVKSGNKVGRVMGAAGVGLDVGDLVYSFVDGDDVETAATKIVNEIKAQLDVMNAVEKGLRRMLDNEY